MRETLKRTGTKGSSEKHRKPARRRRRPVEVRARIIAAATAIFTKDGFKGARMRSIAEHAGVTIQLLVYHFGSKEDLWKVVMLSILGDFEKLHADQPLSASAGADERLRRLIADFVRFTASVPQLHRMMTQETGQLTPRLVWLVDNWIRARFDEFCSLARKGQREGTVRLANPAQLYYATVGISTMAFSAAAEYEYLTGASPFTASEIERTIELINDLVFIVD